MKKFLQLTLITIFILTMINGLFAQERSSLLPHSLTDSEKLEISDYIRSSRMQILSQRNIRKPEGDFYMPAEYDLCEGICLSWMGYSTLVTELAVEASQNIKVFMAVTSSADSVKQRLIAAGAKAENLVMISTRMNSVWMRDFGPYFINKENGDREIIDCIYNRPRPSDDKFPKVLGEHLSIPVHACPMIMPGGNFITDGHGVAIITDVFFDPSQGGDPDVSREQLETWLREYMGITKTIIIKDLHRDGTGHIDIFAKLLDDRNMIVGQLAKPQDGVAGNYEILEENARILAEETNGKGEKFIVTRIPMPKYTYGTTFTHTNSTILNKKVFVPTYGMGTDKAALKVYQDILPDHKIVGFDCRDIITANGAIHCITKLVMAKPLKIEKVIFKEEVKRGQELMVRFQVKSNREEAIIKSRLHFSLTPEGPFTTIDTLSLPEGNFAVNIPMESDKLFYFISCEDEMGIKSVYPENAPFENTLKSIIIE